MLMDSGLLNSLNWEPLPRVFSMPTISAHKLTLSPRGKDFQSANIWGPGDFGS